MIEVRKVDGDYFEYWLEEGERLLVLRLLGIPRPDPAIVIVTVIRKGLDSRDLHARFTESGGDPTDAQLTFDEKA